MQISSTLNMKVTKRSRIYQYLAAFTGILGVVSSEMHYGWPSPSLPALINGTYKIQVTKTEGPWLVVMPLIGAILGAIVTGLAIDTLGRKRLILFSSLPLFVSWIMIGVAENSVLLHVARFMAGLTDGLSFTAVPMYLVSIVIGLLLINILGSYLNISTTAFVSSIVPVILLLTFVWIPESPYFLLMRGRYDDARKSLQIFRGTPDVESELVRVDKVVEDQNKDSGKFLDLFTTANNRKAVLIALGLYCPATQCVGLAFVFFCVPETKGKTLEDIQKYLKGEIKL
ncbi:Sugar tr and/or MFS 1 domain containing protein [Asbolus verrucosus]|uniref:Sugar tr and/or MFS 1 domain containing protein n=1 Tax=Asbolus verrucosus TaxID=1661398 RepID=A0A482W1G6_ASBVE|nr:Sugar tr and/or MFS 1 domain containing protein [Asbolus verrucosus]